MSLKFYIILMSILWVYVESLTVIPERGNVSALNNKYVSSAVFNVRRYSRKSGYFMNFYGTTLHTWANNVTVDIIFSQFLHNEYRRSFIEFHYKLCDFINEEPYVGGMFKVSGIACPLKAGTHYVMNMTAQTKNFPNVFPFEKGRVDATLSITSTKELVIALYAELIFKN